MKNNLKLQLYSSFKKQKTKTFTKLEHTPKSEVSNKDNAHIVFFFIRNDYTQVKYNSHFQVRSPFNKQKTEISSNHLTIPICLNGLYREQKIIA